MISATALSLTPGSIFSCSGVALFRLTTPVTRGGADLVAASADNGLTTMPANNSPNHRPRLMVAPPRGGRRAPKPRHFSSPSALPLFSLPPHGHEAFRRGEEHRAID